jgi:GT2 family glycosyltransferase
VRIAMGRSSLPQTNGTLNPIPFQAGLVTIGIAAWNSARDLPVCLASVTAQEYPHIELIVVDNASGDDSVRRIQAAYPTARIIQNSENRGYCAAHNQAIRSARGEYYLPLNPDIRLEPGFVGRLVRALGSRPEFGSAVGKIFQTSDHTPPRIDSAGLWIDHRRHQYLRGYGLPDRGQFDRAEEIFGADGAAPLHRRAMLEDSSIQGEYFDERHFIYMEDVDLAWRARLCGWRCWYEPEALAWHVRSFKPGSRRSMPEELRRLAVKNRYLTIYKNESPAAWRRDWWRILSYDLLIWGYILLCERSSFGALGLLREQWAGAGRWRRELQSKVKAAPAEQLRWFV